MKNVFQVFRKLISLDYFILYATNLTGFITVLIKALSYINNGSLNFILSS